MATNLLLRGVATRPQINSTTLKQESIGILKKVVGQTGEGSRRGGGRNWQLELQLHARAIRWRVDLENKVYLLKLLLWGLAGAGAGAGLALDMSLLDRLASSGCCAAASCLQLN